MPKALSVHEVPSGTQVFDWTVPDEWRIREAYIEDERGRRIVDFHDNNLHVVGYSVPVDEWMDLETLLGHVYVQEDLPDAIPYVTSYYAMRWGFCMSKSQRDALPQGRYHAVIDSELFSGSLTYGELVVPSTEGCDREVLFSTYCCHPSMANNELSGPCVWAALIRHVCSLERRRYTYRFVIIPETIGSITYLSRNLEHLKSHVDAGFVLSCIGDERAYSLVESPYADTLADRVAARVLGDTHPDYLRYSFLSRGSDERQYCSPGVGLPVVGLCRSKYGEYPEYHTSADDLTLVTPGGLAGGLDLCERIVEALEWNRHWTVTCCGEPQLGRRGMYPTVSKKGSYNEIMPLKNLLAYADGRSDLIGISERIGVPLERLIPLVRRMAEGGLLRAND